MDNLTVPSFDDIKDLINATSTPIAEETVTVRPTVDLPSATPTVIPTEEPYATPTVEVTSLPTESPTEVPTHEPTRPATPSTVDIYERTNRYKPLYEQNNDTIGWIKIAGTKIDYPVMQRKDEVNYYLKRDFYGNFSNYGVPYVMEICDIQQSDNLIIYGHHMKNGSMFSNLIYYQRNKMSYYKTHMDIQFDTFANGDATYRIFAAINASDDDELLHFTDAGSKEEYDDFISKCKQRSLFDTGITPAYGNKLITLATCRFNWSGQINGKFIVVAVKIS